MKQMGAQFAALLFYSVANTLFLFQDYNRMRWSIKVGLDFLSLLTLQITLIHIADIQMNHQLSMQMPNH